MVDMGNRTFVMIGEIIRAWGVPAEDKLNAIRYIMNGADPDKVLKAVHQISEGSGNLKALELARKG